MDEAMRGIEALRRRDEAASKAYDVKALAELWTADAVALPPGGPVKRGPELRRRARRRWPTPRKGRRCSTTARCSRRRWSSATRAVEWGHIEGSERDRSTGKVTSSRFHLMRILRRVEDGSWRVHRSIFAPAGSSDHLGAAAPGVFPEWSGLEGHRRCRDRRWVPAAPAERSGALGGVAPQRGRPTIGMALSRLSHETRFRSAGLVAAPDGPREPKQSTAQEMHLTISGNGQVSFLSGCAPLSGAPRHGCAHAG